MHTSNSNYYSGRNSIILYRREFKTYCFYWRRIYLSVEQWRYSNSWGNSINIHCYCCWYCYC